MCDCFHLAFPNWHGPATGAGRRLRGPEQETEDDSVCEEPETLEGERPRPQGSSPVEEFPTEKQAEEDSPHKSASNKKSRRLGFGSLFDKRSSAKMSETEDIQNGEAGVIVKTVKETCAEGLVVSGGGKEGIFIKEVKPDSPASKHLTVKEGDQILSATVFFDNVSYEDALQILEHAQPYKMELCLRRKMESTTPEDDEIVHPEGNERGLPEMRSPRKKKQQDRISWPKFPSFGKGHRAQFKRSHSTSEAEEHKKLEMSPPTSDTESPLKSPLKSPDGKDKKKKQKIKLKMKMKSPRSKSVEESQRNEKELTSENLIVLEDEQVGGMLDEKLPEKPVTQLVEIPQDNKEAEYGDSSKIVNEVPGLSGMELQHKVHLISLSNTLKTTDLSDALAEASAGDMMISEEGKVQRSEIKFSILQKDKSKIGVDSQSKTILEMSRTSDPSAHDTTVVSHGAIPQADGETSQLVTDIKTEVISKDSSEKNLESGDMKMSMPKLDVSVDLPDIGVLKQSPRAVSEKQWKEGAIFENEIYGIRTRGPLADIVTSKSHFTTPVKGLQFTPPDSSEMIRESNMPETITVISQPELNDLRAVSAIDAKANIHDILGGLDKRSESKFKVPNVDLTGCVIQEPIKMTHLPKREDIEIPGMEDKKSKPSLQTPGIKVPKIINITKEKEIRPQRTDEEFNVEDVKEAVSKFPALKLPEGDITGVLVQREITIMEMKSDKTSTTPRGSPRKISGASDSSITITKSKIGEEKSSASHKDTVIKIPKVEPPYADEQTITMTKIDYSKPKGETQQTKTDKLLTRDDGQTGDVKFKLPKREDIEIPGMEAIEESTVQTIDMKVIKDQRHAPGLQGMSSSLLVEQPSVQIAVQSDIETSERHKMKKHGDKKGQDKKSKKPKVSMPSFGITKPDIRFPDVGIEIPKKEHTDLTLYRMETTSSMPDQKTTDDFKLTVDKKTESINLTEFDDFTVKVPKAAVDISVQDTKLTDIKCPEKDKEGDSVNVDIKAQDIKTEGQGRKFKLPKFEISFPEVKAPKISASKKEGELSRADRKTEVPAMHGEMPYVQIEKDADQQELHSKGLEMKIQRPTFQFPKFGFSKSESKETEADMSVPTIGISVLEGSADGANTGITATVCDAGQKDESKFGASTNIKLPSISVSKLGAKTPTDMSAMDVHVKGHEEELKLKAKPPSLDGDFKLPAKAPSEPEKSVRDTQVKLAAEPQSADIKALEIHKEEEMLSVDMKTQDIQIEGQSSKFKLPKFGIRLPEIKKPKIDLSGAKTELKVSLPERKAEVHPQDEVQDVKTNAKADVPESDSKDSDVKAKQTSFSFPRFGYSKSEVMVSDTDVNFPNIDVSLPEGSAELERTNTKITVSIVDTGEKGETKSGYPAKFKIPSITLPTFGAKAPSEAKDISAVDAQAKGTEISLKETELKLSAEPLSTDKKVPDLELQEKSVDMKTQSIQNEGQGSKFTLPKFGINLPEVKGPKIGSIGLSAAKTETDISLPEVKVEVHPSDIKVQEGVIEVKAEAPEIHSKGLEVKTKQSSFSFPKFGFSKSDNSEVIKVGEISTVDLQAKGSEISVPDAGLKLTAEPLSVDIKGPKIEKEVKSHSIDMTAQDIQIEEQESKFKLPKFGISLPEVTGPKVGSSAAKTEIDISLPEGKMEVHPPDAKLPQGAIKVKADIPVIDSKGTDVSLPEENVELEGPHTDITLSMGETGQKDETKFDSSTKFKLPSMTLPKFGAKAPKGIVDISAMGVQAKGPEISLPEAELKLSAEPRTVDIKGPDVEKEETSLRVDMKGQDMQTKGQGIKIKFPKFGISLPEVKGPKIDSRGTKTEIDISLPEGKMEVHPANAKLPEGAIEVKANIPEIDSKGVEVKTKGPSFSFPKFGFSKSEVKAPKADASLPAVDVSLPEGEVEFDGPNTDITVTVGDTGQKDETKFGSPTKFKLPSITLPKFGAKAPKGTVEISAVNVQEKGYDISLPEAELKLSAEPLSVDTKGPDVELDKSLNVDVKVQDIQTEGQGSTFKLPKFGIGLPKVTGPKVGSSAAKTEIDISLPEGKMEVHPPDAKLPEGAIEVKADIPEIDSESLDVKTKGPSFSFPKFGFSKSEMKAPKADASLSVVDVSLPEGKVELEGPKADITVSMGDSGQKEETKFGSPTKFKLPSITLPKFGAKAPKEIVDTPAVDVQAKGPEISLPEAELKLSAEPLSVDIKGPDVELEKSLSVDVKAQDFETEGQGSTFKLPKFGISLPKVTEPKVGSRAAKTDIDISLPEGKMEVHPPDAKLPEGAIEVKADIPEIDSESLDVKTKGPSFSFPKFGFSKSEMKAPKADASLSVVDVSLPEGKVELEGPKADITISMGDSGQKDETKFGSPTKFKLPSITLPKFGAKTTKGAVEISAVDVQEKGYDIRLPEAELKLSAEPLTVDIKGPDVELDKSLNVDVKVQDIQTEGQGSTFKLPKFGIGLPEVTGPKVGSSAAKPEIDISLPEGKMEVHPPDAKLPEGAIDVKANIPEIDSKGAEVKTKGPSFSFPKFGFSKSEMKAPKADAGLPVVDVSLPEGKVELEGPKADITISMGDSGQKDETKFGSPTKFKLPSITLPKFGAKTTKGAVEISAVDVQEKGYDIRLPEAELKLSAEPLTVDIKGPDVELDKSLNVDVKVQDIQTERQGIKFKLPKFGISLPEVTGPKVGSSAAKTEIDVSLPEEKMEVHPPDAKLPEAATEVKADIPEIDSESLDVKTKGSSFSFPKFGFSKSEMKAPKADAGLPVVDVSLPEGNVELEGPNTDITLSMGDSGQKEETKFGSPTKFKLPSITLPKFGAKAPKEIVDTPAVDVQAKGPEISLPEAELKLSAEPLSVGIKRPDVEQEKKSLRVNVKAHDIQIEEQGIKFKLPNVDTPAVDVHVKGHDISLPDTELKLSAEPLSVDVKGPDVELEKSFSVDVKAQDFETEGQGSTFKLPKFGIGLPKVTGPKVGSRAAKTDIDISLPEGKMEVHPANAKLPEGAIEVKANIPEIDSKGVEVKTKRTSFSFPKFGFSKSEVKAPKADASLPAVDVSLPEGEVEFDGPNTDITVTVGDTGQKDETKFGSPTKFKLPSITLPKFGAKAPKGTVEISAVNVQEKGYDISLPEAELKLSAEPLSVDTKGPDVELDKSLNVDVKVQDIQTEGQGSTFKLPKFGIGLPKVTGPKVGSSAAKTEIDISLPEGKMEVHPPDAKLPEGAIEVKADIPEIDSESLDVKTKGPSFSFPKFGFSKSEMKAPKADASLSVVDVSLPEGKVELEGPKADITLSMGDSGQKEETKFGSPTKFKLPSITLPKFGAKAPKEIVDTPAVDVQAKGPEISLPEAELKLSAEPLSVDIKGPDVELEKSLSVDVKAQDFETEGQGSTFKLPKFGISLPKVTEPKVGSRAAKTDIDISLPEGKMEVHPPDAKLPEGAIEVKADIPEIDSESLDVKTKGPSFSFPKFGFSKSEMKAPKADASLSVVDVSLPEGKVELEGPKADITISMGDSGQKDETKFGSPTKFKLPSITLPKFGAKTTKGAVEISAVDVQEKGYDIRLPEAELKLSAEPLTVDIKGPDVELDKSLNVDVKVQDIQTEGQGSTFKLPKFGIGLPEVTGPKVGSSAAKPEIDISLPEGKMEVHPPDAKLPEGAIDVKANIPEIDSKGAEVKTKGPSFSFPKFGFSKSEMKAPKADAGLPVVDVSLPEGKVELEGPKADITISMGDSGQKDETKFGSPTKFKLPSITLPKFGAKTTKGAVEISAVDVQEKGYDIRLPEAELKLSAEPLTVDIKGPDVELDKSLNVDVKVQDIQTERQGIKFKLPKFGISLPEVTGPKVGSSAAKTEIDVSLPEEKMEVHPPDAKLPEAATEVKADIPEIDSESLDVKTKGSSFSFPKFGFSKSEMKAPKADAGLPVVDVSLPEGNVELEGPNTDITLSMGDSGQKEETKFGSPTKFKLPSITLPKFGAKAPKEIVDTPAVDVQAKGPEISLPEAELKLSAEPLSVDIKGPDVELEKSLSVDVKAQDFETEGQGSTFKLPKFGIGLPKVTEPKVGSRAAKTDIDISLPEGKMEVHPPDAKLPEGAIEVKADIPEIDSKGVEVKTKRTSFSFPKFGFSKSEVKAPKADASLPAVDVSLPEGEVEFDGPNTDITVTVGDTGQKDETKFGSPTKFKLPSITLPKFGAKAPKGTVEISAVDVQEKGYDISLPEAELKLTPEPLSADVIRPEIELKEKSLSVDVKAQDIQTEEQGSKFKLPKFGISLPEVTGPKAGSSAAKTEIDISLPERKMEVHPPDAKLPEGAIEVKANIPEIDSKGVELKTKGPSFSFPKFGFSKSEMKAPKADAGLPAVDVSLPEGNVELEGPKADITVSMGDSGQKDETKFGSPTKFKLPSITLPKFGAKASKGNVDIPAVDVQAKGPEISLPEAELKLTAKPLTVDIKGPDVEKEEKSLRVDMKGQDIQTEGQGIKFKLPKFGISLPEVKGPKIGSSAAKTEIDISLPEGKMEVHPPDAKLPEGAIEVKADIPEIDSESFDVKTKGPSFSFPKFGFSKSEMKTPKADASLQVIDVSLPEGNVELEGPKADITVSMGDSGQRDETKFGSPTKLSFPSITLPKFGTKAPKGNVDLPAVDVQAKAPEISLPDAELKLSAEPLSVDIKGPDVEKEGKSLRVDMKTQDIQTEGQGIKIKFPKFGISLPEVKEPKVGSSAAKTEIDISLPEGKMEVHPPDTKLPEAATEVKADIPEIDSESFDVKTKGPSFSFPKFGFSKSEMKTPKADASLPVVDVSLPEGNVELEGPKADITISMGDSGQKGETKFGSPTKFKLPSITLPKFGTKAPKGNVDIPAVDVQAKGPEISLPDTELKLSAEPLSVGIKRPDVEQEKKSLRVNVKAHDIQIEEQGSKFKLPKFGISLPEVKGPKISSSAAKTDIDISLPERKMEVHPPDAKLPEGAIAVKADIAEIDSKGVEVKTKGPSFSFPKFGFSKSERKEAEADAGLPVVDVSLPEGKEELEGPKADITVSMDDTGQKGETKFGSPTKFKLPSITLPKFGAKAPKGKVDMPAVDVQVKGHDISLPDTELELSAEPLPADVMVSDINKQDISLSVDMKAQNIHTEGQGSKFKLPKFGIGLPEVKGPKVGSSEAKKELDISLPEGKMEVHPPDVDISAEISGPEKDIELNARDQHLKLRDSQAKVEIKDTIQKPPETAVKTEQEEKGSPSKFKLPTIKMSKISISKIKSQDGDNDTGMRVHVPEVILESKHKKETQAQEKSSRFTMPTLGDVLRGFDVEFNVPPLDETERAKTETAPAKLEFSLPSEEGDKIADSEANLENNEKEIMVQTDQKPEDEEKQTKPEKSSWFRFPKFSSPTKTAKVVEKESSQPPKETEESLVYDNKEKEPELSSARETEEDSPTLSLRSSDAFADVSSAQTTEQVGLSLTSPTKVKVKYSESSATVEIGDLHGDVITSTARTELITMEPHQPEKVNIPCSSEMSSSSVDTMRQMSGEIHIIVSNVQNVPSTQRTTIITNVDTQDVQSLPLEGVAMQSDSVLSAENTRVQKERRTVVERHIVKEMSGEEKVFVTRRTQVFEGDSVEPISDDTAFSIQKLRDTVHTEKMRFFESAESNEQNTMSDETSLKYIDSSTEENEGK